MHLRMCLTTILLPSNVVADAIAADRLLFLNLCGAPSGAIVSSQVDADELCNKIKYYKTSKKKTTKKTIR